MTECEKTKQVLKEHLKEIVEWLEKGHSLTYIGQEIMLNSMQRRLDSRTIILERKRKTPFKSILSNLKK